jgi:hypothetical protein
MPPGQEGFTQQLRRVFFPATSSQATEGGAQDIDE